MGNVYESPAFKQQLPQGYAMMMGIGLGKDCPSEQHSAVQSCTSGGQRLLSFHKQGLQLCLHHWYLTSDSENEEI